MSTHRVAIELDDDEMGTLLLVKAHVNKKMGTKKLSTAAVIRAVLADYARKQRLEGTDAENNAQP